MLSTFLLFFSVVTLFDKYGGSQTTILPLVISPSDLTTKAFPFASNSTSNPRYKWLMLMQAIEAYHFIEHYWFSILVLICHPNSPVSGCLIYDNKI